MLHLACLDEVLYGTGSFLNGSVGINTVLIEEVDGVGLQALERPFHDLLDVVGAAIRRCPLPIISRGWLKAELRRNDHVFAEGSEGFTDYFLIDVGAVHFGGIKEGNAAL